MPKRARAKSPPRILELRIALQDIAPEIWRQVLVPDAFTLDEVHRVIQECFGWLDYHLYSFLLDGVEYEAPHEDAEGRDATRTSLASLALQPDSRLEYTYDFGDNWVHDIRLVATHAPHPDVPYPWCVDGARAGPPEDAGGSPGYTDLLRSLADPTDSEFLASRTWVGAHFHPDTFDLRATNRILMLAFPARAR
ncbi:MAG: plasmid pRiA4b ORF-3 family protein [Gemmatimonadaceae bacterium]|nr:plasmid pRiA4b ORF-3 family protein [Gemmatimonadaceae bacterium]